MPSINDNPPVYNKKQPDPTPVIPSKDVLKADGKPDHIPAKDANERPPLFQEDSIEEDYNPVEQNKYHSPTTE